MKRAGKDFDSDQMRKILANSPDLKETRDRLADHMVGFVLLGEDDAFYGGSGTFVSIGDVKAILTAEHVLDNLPEEGPVGLAMPTRFGAPLGLPHIRMEHVTPIRFGRSENEGEGPDLGLLVLPPPVASAIPSTKTFYNLSKRRKQVLESPAAIDGGPWLLVGSADEWTADGPPEAGFTRVKEFQGAVGFGLAENERIIGDFDYLDYPAEYDENYEGPENYKGYSGGSLWQILCVMKDDKIIVKDRILSGVAFWQSGKTGSERRIKCHGRKSIYQRVIDEVMRN